MADDRKEEWLITSRQADGSEVLCGEELYRLFNLRQGRKLRYGKRRWGINLKWGVTEGKTNIRFERLSGDGALKAGESVAIHIDEGGYIRVGPQLFGVALVWKSTPSHTWRIRDQDGSSGMPIRTGQPISLYSKVQDASLVRDYPVFGISLGWYPEFAGADPDRTSVNIEELRRDWVITDRDGEGNAVLPGREAYRLFNVTEERKIRYGERRFGINMKWGVAEGKTNIRFEAHDKDAPIRYGQEVAIHVDGGGYLRKHWRSFGIDLVWQSTPAYQWRIRGWGGSDGAVVRTGNKVSLHNDFVDASLIYGNQNFGINLVWMPQILQPDDSGGTL